MSERTLKRQANHSHRACNPAEESIKAATQILFALAKKYFTWCLTPTTILGRGQCTDPLLCIYNRPRTRRGLRKWRPPVDGAEAR